MGVEVTSTSLKELNEAKRYAAQRENAAAIAFVILAEQGQIDDVTAAEQSSLFAEWVPNMAYAVGQLRQYGGKLYRCIQAHTSQADWEPGAAASLWALTSDPAEEWPAWSQPLGSHDAYAKGAQVTHSGKRWISGVDGNVWEPGAGGVGPDIWAEATE